MYYLTYCSTTLECKCHCSFFRSWGNRLKAMPYLAQGHTERKGTARMRAWLPKPIFLPTMPRVWSQHCPFLHLTPPDFLIMSSCALFPPLSSFLALSTVHFLKRLTMGIIWGPHAKLSESGKTRLMFIAFDCCTGDGKWRLSEPPTRSHLEEERLALGALGSLDAGE